MTFQNAYKPKPPPLPPPSPPPPLVPFPPAVPLAELPECECAVRWSSTDCTMNPQFFCPATSCDGDPLGSWCVIYESSLPCRRPYPDSFLTTLTEVWSLHSEYESFASADEYYGWLTNPYRDWFYCGNLAVPSPRRRRHCLPFCRTHPCLLPSPRRCRFRPRCRRASRRRVRRTRRCLPSPRHSRRILRRPPANRRCPLRTRARLRRLRIPRLRTRRR